MLIWHVWPQYFRGRMRIIYQLTGELPATCAGSGSSSVPQALDSEAARRASDKDQFAVDELLERSCT